MKIKIIPKIKVQTTVFQQRPLHHFNPSHCFFHRWHSGRQPSRSDCQPSHSYSVQAAKESERSVSGCNRSAVPMLRWFVASVCSAKVCATWHNGNVAAHVAFIQAPVVSVIAHSGWLKAVSGLIQSL